MNAAPPPTDPLLRIELAGREYLFSRMTPYQFFALNAHLESVFPHPVDAARAEVDRLADVFTPEERREKLLEAYERSKDPDVWPPTFDKDAGNDYFLRTAAGMAELFFVLLAKHQPEITRDEARDLVRLISMDELNRIVSVLSPKAEGEAADKLRAAGVEPPEDDAPAMPLHSESGAPKAPTPSSGSS